jgi:hypothetical protein
VVFQALPVETLPEELALDIGVDRYKLLIGEVDITAHQVPLFILWHRVEDGQLLV